MILEYSKTFVEFTFIPFDEIETNTYLTSQETLVVKEAVREGDAGGVTLTRGA